MCQDVGQEGVSVKAGLWTLDSGLDLLEPFLANGVREAPTACVTVYVFKVPAIKTLVSCTTQNAFQKRACVTGPVHSPVQSSAFTDTRQEATLL